MVERKPGLLSEGRGRGGLSIFGVALGLALSAILWTAGIVVWLYLDGRL